MVQMVSECMDEPVQLNDEEMERAWDYISNDRVWEEVDQIVLEAIERIVADRKTMIQERKEDEAKDERYQ